MKDQQKADFVLMPHTPRSWVIDPSTRIDDKYTWVFGPDGSPVAGTSGRIRIDDAYLIAAAPDLLEACKAIWGAVVAYQRIGFEGSELLEVMSDVKAAIAKAEGR